MPARGWMSSSEAGLADETIVFYFADHGSGMPRNKRSACNSGLQVPLVVYIPDKFRDLRPPDYQAGGRTERLVSFVDFAPTVLSLAGIQPPAWMQGHAFLGPHAAAPQPYVFGLSRPDGRALRPGAQRQRRPVRLRCAITCRINRPGSICRYMFQTPTTRVWHDCTPTASSPRPKMPFGSRKPQRGAL